MIYRIATLASVFSSFAAIASAQGSNYGDYSSIESLLWREIMVHFIAPIVIAILLPLMIRFLCLHRPVTKKGLRQLSWTIGIFIGLILISRGLAYILQAIVEPLILVCLFSRPILRIGSGKFTEEELEKMAEENAPSENNETASKDDEGNTK